MMKKTTFGLISIYLILLQVSCTINQKNEPCECEDYKQINMNTVFNTEDLPTDLTCVVSMVQTVEVLSSEIESQYQLLYDTEINENIKAYIHAHIIKKLNQWLGGPQIGICGNLYEGFDYQGYAIEGNSFDIKIDVIEAQLLGINGPVEKGPQTFVSDLVFKTSVSDSRKGMRESNSPKLRIVVSTCAKFIE